MVRIVCSFLFSIIVLQCLEAQCLQGDCFNEVSRFRFKNGAVYEGKMLNGKLHGTGTFHYSSGEIYTGEWKLNKREGPGKLIDKDGIEFHGNFYNNHPDGIVRVYYPDGVCAETFWVNGVCQDIAVKSSALVEEPKYVSAPTSAAKPANQSAIQHVTSADVNIYALIVGASRYDHFKTLMYTDDDAYQVYAFLKSPEGGAVPDDHIRILIDESAVAANIYQGLDDITAMAGPEDVVLIYFAGHGLQGFYVPTDSDGYRNRVEYADIKDRLSSCKARQKLVIADACYSGSLLASKSAIQESVDKLYRRLSSAGGGTAFLLSSKSEEYSLESQGLKQGIFSHYLIAGLKGQADTNADHLVTLDELYQYIYTHVRDYSGNLQSPVLAGDIDRSMPLASVR